MTITTDTDATGYLPAGHDDPASRWYVEPELRAHYLPTSRSEVRAYFRKHSAARDLYARAMVKIEYADNPPPERPGRKPMLDEPERLVRAYQAQAAEYDNYWRERAARRDELEETMDPEDEAWWFHVSVALHRARLAKKRSDDRQHQLDAWDSQHLCEACAEVEPSTLLVQIDADAGTVLHVKDPRAHRFPDRRPGMRQRRLCTPCADTAAEQLRNDYVLGRPRADVVADWLNVTLPATDLPTQEDNR